jgi:hypothetical protein
LGASQSILIKKSTSPSTHKRSKSRKNEFPKDSVLDVLKSLNLSTAAFLEEKLKYEANNDGFLTLPTRRTNSLKILKDSSSSQSKDEGQESISSSNTRNQGVATR